jgi:hypothetical protein
MSRPRLPHPRGWVSPEDLPTYLRSHKAKSDEIAIWNAAIDACAKLCIDSYVLDRNGQQELSHEKRIQQLAVRGTFKTLGRDYLPALKIKRFREKGRVK